jgi:hypothetical protein
MTQDRIEQAARECAEAVWKECAERAFRIDWDDGDSSSECAASTESPFMRAATQAISAAIAEEREQCAKVADSMRRTFPITGSLYSSPVEDAIRARGGA